MHAIEECRVANDTLQGVCDLPAHLGLVVETSLAVFHLTTKIRAGVEPEARCVLDLVAGSIEIVQSVREPIERVRVQEEA